jgi:hypothetical protein
VPAPPSNRIGRYDNPYRVATWHRDPPAGMVCTPLLLDTQDRALAHGWLYATGGERSVAVLMHPRADFSHHYVVPGLLEAGIAVLCVNSRWLNNDATLIHEQVLLDVAAGVAAARDRFDHVTLVGNSGGASLFTFYLHQAHAPAGGRLAATAAGDAFDLNRFVLPGADAMVYLAGHAGEGHYLLHAIDPSVTDEDDPVSCDPELDLYDARNGFVEPPDEPRYATELLDRYRAAQRVRVARIDARARELVGARREARARWAGGTGTVEDRRLAIATSFLRVYRTDAGPRGGSVARPGGPRLRLDLGSAPGLDQLRRGRVRSGREPGGVALYLVRTLVPGRDRDDRCAHDAARAPDRLRRRQLHLPVGRRAHRELDRTSDVRPGHRARRPLRLSRRGRPRRRDPRARGVDPRPGVAGVRRVVEEGG